MLFPFLIKKNQLKKNQQQHTDRARDNVIMEQSLLEQRQGIEFILIMFFLSDIDFYSFIVG